jgi:hypothetical protein
MSIIYKTNPDYSIQTISGVTVIIPTSENCPKFNGMMKLEGIGPFLWNLFYNGSSFEDACEKVISKYDVSEEIVKKDIQAFIDSLSKNGLLYKFSE